MKLEQADARADWRDSVSNRPMWPEVVRGACRRFPRGQYEAQRADGAGVLAGPWGLVNETAAGAEDGYPPASSNL